MEIRNRSYGEQVSPRNKKFNHCWKLGLETENAQQMDTKCVPKCRLPDLLPVACIEVPMVVTEEQQMCGWRAKMQFL